MSFRGAIKKVGGGFWSNVDGELTGYKFETFDSKKGETFVSFVPEVQVDGAEAPDSRSLMLGYADRFEISEDGRTLTAADGGPVNIPPDLPAGLFFDSLVEAGQHLNIENILPDLEGGQPLNVEGLIGTRFRLGQKVNVEYTARKGKQKGKDGKEYDRKDSVVLAVYSLPGVTAAKTTATKGGPKLVAGTNEVRDKADEAIIALCQAAAKADKKNATGRIPTSKLSVGVLKQLAGDKLKDAVRKLVNDEAYLTGGTERGMFVFDESESTVELAA